MKEYNKPKHVFLLAGLSESGKSYAGKFFDDHGIRRLKYVKLFAHEILQQKPDINPYQLLDNSTETDEEQAQRATRSLFQICESENILYCSIESMVKPSTTIAFKQAIGTNRVSVVYFDIEQEIRLHRQMGRENVDYETARKIMLPRDEKKIQFGTPKIKDIADIVIDNSGTIEELNQKLRGLMNEYCI
jgi:dephospho-CoA kinase